MVPYTGIKHVDDFIRLEIDNCEFHDIEIEFIHDKQVKTPDGCPSAGWFTTDRLVTATDWTLEQWLSVFVHESCHKDQYIQKAKSWEILYKGEDPCTILNDWMNRVIELNEVDLKNVVRLAQRVELDCEIRTVKKIKKYNLPIDLEGNIKRANENIFSYAVLRLTRTWDNTPEITKEIYDLMPSVFLNDYDTPPSRYVEIVKSWY